MLGNSHEVLLDLEGMGGGGKIEVEVSCSVNHWRPSSHVIGLGISGASWLSNNYNFVKIGITDQSSIVARLYTRR